MDHNNGSHRYQRRWLRQLPSDPHLQEPDGLPSDEQRLDRHGLLPLVPRRVGHRRVDRRRHRRPVRRAGPTGSLATRARPSAPSGVAASSRPGSALNGLPARQPHRTAPATRRSRSTPMGTAGDLRPPRARRHRRRRERADLQEHRLGQWRPWHGDGSTGAGADLNSTTTQMGCTACHNPHGNGNYRILNPTPRAGTPRPWPPPR